MASNYVSKCYMETVDRNIYFEDVRLQMEAKLWGEEYNRHRPPKQVRGLVVILPLRTQWIHIAKIKNVDVNDFFDPCVLRWTSCRCAWWR